MPNSEQNAQDLPSLLFAQATTAIEECDATKAQRGTKAGITIID